ncbi:MAG TPA: helix-turn-helix domain-containing protein [Thermoleophilaceae bacterium]
MAAPAATAAKAARQGSTKQGPQGRSECCTLYHQAVEMVGKRWTGAILMVLLDGPLRFSEVRSLVPDLSDRLLSERLKELEAEGIVARRVLEGTPVRVEYALSEKGRALEPAVRALKAWANAWLD